MKGHFSLVDIFGHLWAASAVLPKPLDVGSAGGFVRQLCPAVGSALT